MTRESIAQVLQRHATALMAIDGVVGVGEGEMAGKPCVIVYATIAPELLRPHIERVLSACPIRIEPTDAFHAGSN